jgi:hypothetical protein
MRQPEQSTLAAAAVAAVLVRDLWAVLVDLEL